MKLQRLHPLQQGRSSCLGVDNAVAGLGPGVLSLNPLHSIAYLLQSQIPNGVNRHVHPAAVGRPDQLIQLLRSVDGDAVVVRLVHIAGDYLRRLSPQGTVLKQFPWAGAKQAGVVLRSTAQNLKVLKFPRLQKTLFVYSDGERFFPLQLPVQFHQMGGRRPGQHLQIVGVDAGDAGGVQVRRPLPDHLLDLPAALRGNDLHVEAHGLLPKKAVLCVHFFPHRRWNLVFDALQPS